jgi:hypothetical protein
MKEQCATLTRAALVAAQMHEQVIVSASFSGATRNPNGAQTAARELAINNGKQ